MAKTFHCPWCDKSHRISARNQEKASLVDKKNRRNRLSTGGAPPGAKVQLYWCWRRRRVVHSVLNRSG